MGAMKSLQEINSKLLDRKLDRRIDVQVQIENFGIKTYSYVTKNHFGLLVESVYLGHWFH